MSELHSDDVQGQGEAVSRLWLDAYFVELDGTAPVTADVKTCDIAETTGKNLETFLDWINREDLANVVSVYEHHEAEPDQRGKYLGTIAVTPEVEPVIHGFTHVLSENKQGLWLAQGLREPKELKWYLRHFASHVPVILANTYDSTALSSSVNHGAFLDFYGGNRGNRHTPVYLGLHGAGGTHSRRFVEQLFPFEGRDEVTFDLERLFPRIQFDQARLGKA